MTWVADQPADKVATVKDKLRSTNPPQWQWATKYAEGDTNFAVWLYLANSHVYRRLGMDLYDGEDFLWRDEFDAGTSPREAARTYLAECN